MAVGLLVFQNGKGVAALNGSDRKEVRNEEAPRIRVPVSARSWICGLRRERLLLTDGADAPVQRHALAGSAAHAHSDSLLSPGAAADMSNLTYRRRPISTGASRSRG